MISAERLSELIDVCDAYAAEHPHENDEQIAQCMRELEAARARIVELEAQRRDWLDNDITARTLVAQEREIEQLRAQGLSQQLNFYPYVRNLEACSIPSCYRHHADKDVGKRNCSCGLDATILRRMRAQTT